MSKAVRRDFYRAKKNQPAFVCFKCRERFQLAFGDPCRERNFQEPEWCCKDCQERHSNIRRA